MAVRHSSPAFPGTAEPLLSAFGKIRAHGDYVRIGAIGDAGRAVQHLLLEGVDRLSVAHATLPREPVYFVVPADTGQSIAAGAFLASEDSVGRRFPLSIHVELPWSSFGSASLVPVACGEFFAAVGSTLEASHAIDARELERRLASFPLPSAATVATARQRCNDVLRSEDAHRFLARTTGDASGYAFETLRQACDPIRTRPPTRADVVLECPLAIDVDLFAWLELVGRALRFSIPFGFAWTEETPRLLVALGMPRPTLLPMLARHDREVAGLWPLTTSNPSAVHSAAMRWQALTQAVSGGMVLETLLERVAGGGS